MKYLINLEYEAKKENPIIKNIPSILCIILSLPCLVFTSITGTNEVYTGMMHANKMAYLIGIFTGTVALPAILGLILYIIRRKVMKKKNARFLFPFSIILLFTSLIKLSNILN